MFFFQYENIIYFDLLASIIQIRFDVAQLLTLLRSLLGVNVNSRAFSSANEVDRVQSSANSVNLNMENEFGKALTNNWNNNGPRDPFETRSMTYWRRGGGNTINYSYLISFSFTKIKCKPLMWDSSNSEKILFWQWNFAINCIELILKILECRYNKVACVYFLKPYWCS